MSLFKFDRSEAAGLNPVRVRTITAGVELTPAFEPDRVEAALACLKRAKQAFQAAGYEVQTIRLATNPVIASLSASARDKALDQLRQIDEYVAAQGAVFNTGPIATDDRVDEGLVEWSQELARATRAISFSTVIASPDHGVMTKAAAMTAKIMIALAQALLGIVVEVQLSRDARKKYAWPVYAASLRARLECPVQVLVISDSDAVAHWAATPVDIGGGNLFKPIAIGPAGIPEIVDEAEVDPELAVLSALTHAQSTDFMKSARLAAAAQRASMSLDSERADLYVWFIHNLLSEAARRALHDMSANPKFQFDVGQMLFEKGEIRGRDQGEHEVAVRLVTKQLTKRFGPLDDAARSRIVAAYVDDIEDVGERLLTAATLEEALGNI